MIQNIYVSRDASGWEIDPNHNDNGVTIQIQGYEETTNRKRFCVHYNHLELPSGIISIDEAIIYIYCSSPSASATVGLYKITTNWTETGVTWNVQPTHTDLVVNISGAAAGWRTANITNCFRYWWNSTWTNYGLKGKYPSELGNDNTIYWHSDTGANKSYVKVTFTLPPPPPPLPKIGVGVGNPLIL